MLSTAQRDTILASLRAYQHLLEGAEIVTSDKSRLTLADFLDIASDSGEPLTFAEIDTLIDRDLYN